MKAARIIRKPLMTITSAALLVGSLAGCSGSGSEAHHPPWTADDVDQVNLGMPRSANVIGETIEIFAINLIQVVEHRPRDSSPRGGGGRGLHAQDPLRRGARGVAPTHPNINAHALVSGFNESPARNVTPISKWSHSVPGQTTPCAAAMSVR